jgi:hypothetical protein
MVGLIGGDVAISRALLCAGLTREIRYIDFQWKI